MVKKMWATEPGTNLAYVTARGNNNFPRFFQCKSIPERGLHVSAKTITH